MLAPIFHEIPELLDFLWLEAAPLRCGPEHEKYEIDVGAESLL
jgi:hypothetical protein